MNKCHRFVKFFAVITFFFNAQVLANDNVFEEVSISNADVQIFTENRSSSSDYHLVYLSGLGSPLKSWDVLDQHWKAEASSTRYQRRGIEPSTGDNSTATLSDHLADLKAVISSIPSDKDIVLVAHSFGSLIARGYAHKYPEDIKGVILIDPTPDNLMHEFGFDETTLQAIQEQNIQGVAGMGQSAQNEMRLSYVLESMMKDFPLPNLPVAVVSSYQQMPDGTAESWGVDQAFVDRSVMMKLIVQQRIIKDSGNSIHFVTGKSGHNLHTQEPELVTSALNWIKKQN